ncbi:MAG TPA: VOC family protein [Thermoanaerobaculia bacterium]|nr:VOC family protein [Thermoanaerobaculia bacterium]
MEIRQFRVVVRAMFYDRALKFYGDALALPRLHGWEREDARGTVFQAGAALLEVIGPPASEDPRRDYDERFESRGPQNKATLLFEVPSAQKAFEEIQFREQNIPGGLRKDDDGVLIFETHDPDGVRVVFKETGG